jgi:hypothetical protein
MFWINRAFLLEREGAAVAQHDIAKAERNISRAADAYRAALQVMKHPSAILALSLTCRVVDNEVSPSSRQYAKSLDDLQRKEGFSYMREYLAATGAMNQSANAIGGVMALEKAAANSSIWSKDLYDDGRHLLDAAMSYGGLDGVLDVGLIQDIRNASTNKSENQKKDSDKSEFLQLSLPRKIMHDPSRPELWLALAKQLVKNGPSPDLLNRACFASDRASSMLKRQWIRSSDSDAPAVDSRTFSESLSLSYWLGNASAGTEGTKEASAYELQMALIMCPNNQLARHALKCSTKEYISIIH